MKKIIKNLIFVAVITLLCFGHSKEVSSATTFVKPTDMHKQVEYQATPVVSVEEKQANRSRAPEPSTMVLFGGGFFGMVLSFFRRLYAGTKRVFDVLAVCIGVIVLSPLLLLTAILVKLTSKGPMIYSQVRVGEDGKHFKMYKFRTMKVDAEKDTGPVWAQTNDNRLTPVGSFLRKAHIDELPQLFNILKGEMSLIGPRPERPVFVAKFKKVMPDYEKRLMVKPGLTGLAQVWHTYDETIVDVKKKLKYDLLYIRRMCFLTDLMIILRTFRVVVTGEGAK